MSGPTLPAHARLPINRCNLPSVILGGLTFQRHPVPLAIDGVRELHAALFAQMDGSEDAAERADRFTRHMKAHFLLDHPEEAGFDDAQAHRPERNRSRADYRRLLRGWSFDPDGREAAVLKGWVESRFGLLTQHHGGLLDAAESRRRFDLARAAGLYNTNALEAQLDLLYTWCQYELELRHAPATHLTLYRGSNRIEAHESLDRPDGARRVLLLNNLNSFTCQRERADEFGDYVMQAEIPLARIVFFTNLLPGLLRGEGEYAVLGGVCEVRVLG
ncbi:MAG: NAD(+)--dinitrogen-reductase ADP-D-ribosyltransferase [Ectothiorhodospiraceae bacterium]|nr:NAD(+)--dinitrogen-reductase ADP-D-ribosyltransferase [Ectothiorhodospiraceae bacterium]